MHRDYEVLTFVKKNYTNEKSTSNYQNTFRFNGTDIRIKQIPTIHAHAATARNGW